MTIIAKKSVVVKARAISYITCMRFNNLKAALFPVLMITIFTLFVIFFEDIMTVFKNTDDFSKWVKTRGATPWLIFVLVQIVQVIIFMIPGEIIQIAGGYLFGIFFGCLLSFVGIMIGSLFNFFIARISGALFIERLIGKSRFARFRAVLSSKRQTYLFFALFLVPGIPKDIICYIAGLSRISFLKFILFSGLGRLPGIIGTVVVGSALLDRNLTLVIIVASLSVIVFVLGIIFRKKLPSA